MRETRHRHVLLVALSVISVRSLREHQSQHLAGYDRIVGIGFIEIPYPIEQQCLRMLGLYGEILLKQRCILVSLRHLSSTSCRYEISAYS